MDKITVIVPAHNTGRFIAKTLYSVIAQTYTNFEVLVIDDGSTDHTYDVASSVKDNRIKVFRTSHEGLSAARNYGLKKASGDFIYFLDSDDWIEPDLLDKNLNCLKKECLEFVIWGYYRDFLNAKEKLISTSESIPQNMRIIKGRSKYVLDGNHLDLLGYAWNKLYRKSFLERHRLQFEVGTSLIEDVLFNSQVIMHSRVIRFIDKGYYHYINRPEKSLISTFRFNAFELIKRRRDILETWVKPWKIKNGKEMLSYSFITGIRYCMYNLFGFENQLSYHEKKEYVKKMFADPVTRQSLAHFVPDSHELVLYKKIIEHKMVDVACERLTSKGIGSLLEDVKKSINPQINKTNKAEAVNGADRSPYRKTSTSPG